jgi:uncharacterized protein YjbJ (UPF0337 family)
MLAGTF